MATQKHTSASQINVADVLQQLDIFKSDIDISSGGLVIFNEKRFCSLRPLATKLFTALVRVLANESSAMAPL